MNNTKHLSSLLAFAEVARQQSFTLAAKQLGMSKSAISQQIKRLEEHIGQQLLSRHTRGMSLTAAGKKLLNRCELLQDQVNLAFEEINSTKETPSGIFALTVPHSCEKNIVIPALNQLCIEYPDIQPNVLVTDEAIDLIQENLDVAIYAGELKDSNYRALPIGSTGEIICASSTYLQKYEAVNKIEDLYQHRWISTLWQNNNITIYNNESPSDKIELDVDYFAKSNTLPTVLEMLLHDMGMALLPEFVLQESITKGLLVRVLPTHQGRQWPFYMVHRFQNEKPVHITRFYQLVKHFFSKANS
ncbi:MAG: LysR family transcriptional regulator [Methylococcales bacterium]